MAFTKYQGLWTFSLSSYDIFVHHLIQTNETLHDTIWSNVVSLTLCMFKASRGHAWCQIIYLLLLPRLPVEFPLQRYNSWSNKGDEQFHWAPENSWLTTIKRVRTPAKPWPRSECPGWVVLIVVFWEGNCFRSHGECFWRLQNGLTALWLPQRLDGNIGSEQDKLFLVNGFNINC